MSKGCQGQFCFVVTCWFFEQSWQLYLLSSPFWLLHIADPSAGPSGIFFRGPMKGPGSGALLIPCFRISVQQIERSKAFDVLRMPAKGVRIKHKTQWWMCCHLMFQYIHDCWLSRQKLARCQWKAKRLCIRDTVSFGVIQSIPRNRHDQDWD